MLRNGTTNPEREDRYLLSCTDLRTQTRGDSDRRQIVGYAAVFNQVADLWWFREMIAPGAFARALGENQDVRALVNHDANLRLGRTVAIPATLELDEDEHGLFVRITPPDTQMARDLMVEIDRGDIDQMSFGFTIRRQEWVEEEGEETLRIVREIDQLFDVSAVTFPAYEGTSLALRSAGQAYMRHLAGAGLVDEAQRADLQTLAAEVVAAAGRGMDLASNGAELRARRQRILPSVPTGPTDGASLEDDPTGQGEAAAQPEGRQAAEAGRDGPTGPDPQDVVDGLVGY